MTRRTIAWHRLLPRHRRLLVWWIIAGLGVAGPWAMQLLSRPSASSGEPCRVTRISDGDTIRATCQGEALRVRLYCIDAPETDQHPWGADSTEHLRRITPTTIGLVRHNTDRYGRVIGELFDGETSLNLAMVRVGQAAVYPQYCSDPAYFSAERAAKSAGLGIWRTPGLHQRPWEWRRR